MELEIQKTLRYQLIGESKIETECGALYRAQEVELGRTVAIKSVNILGDTPSQRQANYQKARTEVQAMVRIAEEAVNIPRIFTCHYDEKNSVFYIVMEWIRGRTLEERMNAPELQFLNWMIALCDILETMERKRLYHKDIKPANIMLSETGKLYLIDFNISISSANRVEGTAHYKAPEMDIDSTYQGREKVDMFSIGVMLYAYYTGAVPIRGQDYARNRRWGPLEWDQFTQPKEKNPQMSETVNNIVIKCMKLDPRQRYSRIGDLKAELRKAVREIGKTKR